MGNILLSCSLAGFGCIFSITQFVVRRNGLNYVIKSIEKLKCVRAACSITMTDYMFIKTHTHEQRKHMPLLNVDLAFKQDQARS